MPGSTEDSLGVQRTAREYRGLPGSTEDCLEVQRTVWEGCTAISRRSREGLGGAQLCTYLHYTNRYINIVQLIYLHFLRSPKIDSGVWISQGTNL